MMNYQPFQDEVEDSIVKQSSNHELLKAASDFQFESVKSRYSYNFSCLGRPIIQYPQDIVKVQELIYHVNPELIIETGVAHGGSVILSASMLALLDHRDRVEGLQPRKRKVLAIDIDIRPHNRKLIENHFLYSYIELIESSSTCPSTYEDICKFASEFNSTLVLLDSNHTHAHVLRELQLYSRLVSPGSYIIAFDTLIEDMPDGFFADRPWSKGNNPLSAVNQFLAENPDFTRDSRIDAQLLVSAARMGYLKKS